MCPWLPVTHWAWIGTRHPISIHRFYTCPLQHCAVVLLIFQHLSKGDSSDYACWGSFVGCLYSLWIPCFCREEHSNEFDSGLTTLQFLPQAQWLPCLLPPTNHLLSPDGGSKFELMDSSFFSFTSWVQCFRIRLLTFLCQSFSILQKWEWY